MPLLLTGHDGDTFSRNTAKLCGEELLACVRQALVLVEPCKTRCCVLSQGRVRTKTVKRASRVVIEKYYQRLTQDFDINKRVLEEVAQIQTKRLRNKIAGFMTVCFAHRVHAVLDLASFQAACYWSADSRPRFWPWFSSAQHLMKRIQGGPVRGISLKLQVRGRWQCQSDWHAPARTAC
jgi:ribosomal protein S17E